MSLDSSYFDDDIFGNSLSNGINGFPTGIVIAAAAALVLFIVALIAFKTVRKIFGGIFLAAGIGGLIYGFIRLDSLESKVIRAIGQGDKQMIAAFVAGGVVLVLGIIMLVVGSSGKKNIYTGQMQPPPNYQMPNPNYQMQPPPNYQVPNQGYQATNHNYQMQQPQNYASPTPSQEVPAQIQCSICQALNNPGSKFCCNCGNQL